MSEEKELFILISKQLDKISQEIKNIDERLYRLEGKTNDLHQYIPFVGWLEEVGQNISYRFSWLRDYRQPPQIVNCEESHNRLLE
jgi:hypothetical protein